MHVDIQKYNDASVFYNAASEVSEPDLKRWLEESCNIQWDYKNLVKRKGKLERLNGVCLMTEPVSSLKQRLKGDLLRWSY